MAGIRFFKGEALGNDYIVVRRADLPLTLTEARVRALCDRHVGIGGDGVIAVGGQDPTYDAEVWNADGSRAEVSGNGLRIAALWLHRGGAAAELELRSGGVSYPIQIGSERVTIRLPPARIAARRAPVAVADGTALVTEVDVGNPHAVVEADVVGSAIWPALAAALERHPRWRAGVNVERVSAASERAIEVDLHERGVGPTRASGTGACAAACAALELGLVQAGPIEVRMRGGHVVVDPRDGLLLAGPVTALFEGELSGPYTAQLAALDAL